MLNVTINQQNDSIIVFKYFLRKDISTLLVSSSK